MRKIFLIGTIFAVSSVSALQYSPPAGPSTTQVTPSSDAQSSTSPRNAPSLTDPSAKPLTPPEPTSAPNPLKSH